jgi:hypothetical protein
MNRLSIACFLVAIIIAQSIIPCLSKQVSGGSDISIYNSDEQYSNTDANPPVYNINYKTISDARDPIQYDAPTREYNRPDQDDDNDDDEVASNETGLLSRNAIQSLYFKMTSDINGTGTLNNLRLIDASGKSSLRLTSGVTKTGEIIHKDIVSLIDRNPGDYLNISRIGLVDHIEFNGQEGGASYLESGIYNNNGDIIHNRFNVKTILKDTQYDAQTYRNQTQGELDYLMDNVTYKWKSMKYKLDMGFTGKYDFEQNFQDTSIISESYIGGFVLHTNISSNVSCNLTGKVDHWLPCCQNNSNSISIINPVALDASL